MAIEVVREEMEVDVLIVGGGSAGLSAALHLKNQIDFHNGLVQEGKRLGPVLADPMIVVLEKGNEIGAHSFSGAVMNPVALRELVPNYRELGCPIESEVHADSVYFLSRSNSFKFPIVPPPFKNEGNYIVSVSKLNRWLGKLCEERGINIFPGFAAVEVLYDGDKVVGVRTGDKGLDKDGKHKPNFEAGMLLKSRVTIFAEGTRGSLFKQLASKLNLYAGKNPDVYEEGVKEIIQMPEGTVQAGEVIHTMGFPFSSTIGGTFLYTLANDQIALGLVGYLDTKDPLFDPHRELQRLKTHPFIYERIKGGRVIAYGGKTLPAGGWYSMPKLYHDGCLVIGDAASMVDVKRLKGIHLAMKSGMLAAETALDALVGNDFSSSRLKGYSDKIQTSYVKDDLYKTRNFHQTLSMGLVQAAPLLALQEITGGRGLVERMTIEKDLAHTEPAVEIWGANPMNHEDVQLPKPDGVLFFDKLGSVYLTGTMHDENSPNHLFVANTRICSDVCYPKYKSPCNHFCPASVYEMVEHTTDASKKQLQVNYTNCIHCKTCDIKCPADNILWTPPEGGGGPNYKET